MKPARKITIEVPPDLLDKAQRATGRGKAGGKPGTDESVPNSCPGAL
jgi:hypothetical protein